MHYRDLNEWILRFLLMASVMAVVIETDWIIGMGAAVSFFDIPLVEMLIRDFSSGGVGC